MAAARAAGSTAAPTPDVACCRAPRGVGALHLCSSTSRHIESGPSRSRSDLHSSEAAALVGAPAQHGVAARDSLPQGLATLDLKKIVTSKIMRCTQLADIQHILWNYGPELDHIHLAALVLQLARLNSRQQGPRPSGAADQQPPAATSQQAAGNAPHASTAPLPPPLAAGAPASDSVGQLMASLPSRTVAIIAAQAIKRTSRAAARSVASVAVKRMNIGDDPNLNVPQLAADVSRLLHAQLDALGPSHIANVVYGFGKLGYYNKRLLTSLLLRAQDQLTRFTPQVRRVPSGCCCRVFRCRVA